MLADLRGVTPSGCLGLAGVWSASTSSRSAPTARDPMGRDQTHFLRRRKHKKRPGAGEERSPRPTQHRAAAQTQAPATQPEATGTASTDSERQGVEEGLEAFRAAVSGIPCGSCQGSLRPGQECLECEREGVAAVSMFACRTQPQTSHKEPCRCASDSSPPSPTPMVSTS